MRASKRRFINHTLPPFMSGRQLVRLNRLPRGIEAKATKVYCSRDSQGFSVVLCPVDKLNNLPKRFAPWIQGIMGPGSKEDGIPVWISQDGTCYLVAEELSTPLCAR